MVLEVRVNRVHSCHINHWLNLHEFLYIIFLGCDGIKLNMKSSKDTVGSGLACTWDFSCHNESLSHTLSHDVVRSSKDEHLMGQIDIGLGGAWASYLSCLVIGVPPCLVLGVSRSLLGGVVIEA